MNACEVAVLLELAPVVVPEHSRPVIQPLQGQMDVFIGLELQHGQPALTSAGEHVNHGAIRRRESRHLRIDVGRVETGVYGSDVLEYQRL